MKFSILLRVLTVLLTSKVLPPPDDELSDDAIIRFNASSPSHSLDGVSIIGASGGTGHPAVEMVQGTLGGGARNICPLLFILRAHNCLFCY